MLVFLPALTDGYKVEDRLHDMTDGDLHVVAIEMFGPPEAMRFCVSEQTEVGPWVLGTFDEATEYAEETGWDYEVQYTIGNTE